MIKEISSNNPKFKTVTFHQGFNVILAERSTSATDKDSRNGLGKSSLINIIHFLFGSNPGREKGLRRDALSKWTYKMVFTIGEDEYTVERSPERFSEVYLTGNFSDWIIQPRIDTKTNKIVLKTTEWNQMLGNKFFNLPVDVSEKYYPSFRGLFSFFAREGTDAYNEPFQHLAKQLEWDKQVQNSYLLNLNYEYAIQLQHLKDKEETLNQLKKAADQGLLGQFIGSIGDLEAERVRLSESVKKLDRELKNFQVHPEYKEIQKEANTLTERIQSELNERNISEQLLNKYRENLGEENDVSSEFIQQIYNEAGLIFPSNLIKTIDDINDFHSAVIRNRQEYLKSEITTLERDVSEYESSIITLSNRRKELLSILQTHGALEEYFRIQQRLLEKQQALNAVSEKIDNLQRFEEGKSDLKIEKEDLLKKMRRDYNERKNILDRAIALFNKNSEFLYDEPGNLVIDVKDTGYKFRIDIKRSGSHGIDRMKVLCYDLTLTQIEADRKLGINFLIHDSSIFDGVDERQIAKGMERAYSLSTEWGFQYICTLNSDSVPTKDFSVGFKDIFDSSVRLVLDDSTEEGGLFGFRF